MLKAICSSKELTNNSYYACISDIIGSKQVQELKSITHHISTTRFQHCVNVSYYSYIVCRVLKLNARSAARAGLLHDLYAYKSGSYDDHARLGAEYARKLLNKLALTTEEETEVICRAIRHHDGKAEADGPMDEILKDADVIHHSLGDPTKEVKAHERERYAKLCAELGWTD